VNRIQFNILNYDKPIEKCFKSNVEEDEKVDETTEFLHELLCRFFSLRQSTVSPRAFDKPTNMKVKSKVKENFIFKIFIMLQV
jgi:hypothetical protein